MNNYTGLNSANENPYEFPEELAAEDFQRELLNRGDFELELPHMPTTRRYLRLEYAIVAMLADMRKLGCHAPAALAKAYRSFFLGGSKHVRFNRDHNAYGNPIHACSWAITIHNPDYNPYEDPH